jgi:hypothetical protein
MKKIKNTNNFWILFQENIETCEKSVENDEDGSKMIKNGKINGKSRK